MTTLKRLLPLLAILLAVPGCETTGFSPREHSGSYPAFVNSLYQKEPEPPPAQPLHKPIHLAVAQIGESSPAAPLLRQLEGHPDLVATRIGIPMPGDPGSDRISRREPTDSGSGQRAAELAAARHLARQLGADYLFLVGGNIDTGEVKNALAVLNFTIIGGAIVPGSRVRAEGKAAGALIEVASGRVLLLVHADQEKTGLTPAYFVQDKSNRFRLQLRDQLLRKLGEQLLMELRQAQ